MIGEPPAGESMIREYIGADALHQDIRALVRHGWRIAEFREQRRGPLDLLTAALDRARRPVRRYSVTYYKETGV